MICTLCMSQLRQATAFKKQVLDAERQLDLCFQDTGNATKGISSIKENVKFEESNKTVSAGNLKTKSVSEKNLESSLKLKQTRNRIRNKRVFKTIAESENGEIDPGYDSDIPISELIKTPCQEKSVTPGKAEKDIKNDIIGVHKVRNRISERKRVILTCSIVLKDTTACPFRHHKSWFQCFFCLQDFMDINTLKKHTSNNHKDIDTELNKLKSYPRSLQIDISNLKCRHCCLTLTDVNTMRRHLVEVHNKIIYTECIADYKVNSSPYSCHICKREFHVFRTLTTHLNEHYPNCICDVCGKSFLNTKRLKVHKRTHENGTYPCKKCGKVLKTKISITNHMETHSKRIIKCQICLKPMKHYNARIKHMSEEHNITYKFKCPICYREYNIKHYLATHIRQTHGNKNKKCTECDMAFITNHGLKKHMLKHTGEKPYTCTVCCKSYARSYTLREHMRAHVDKKCT
ncbi:PREDICTED: zinc finger protein 62 homolog isoform X2 [Papilio polytes]|nr:PREDICTED: zinc finger protein 62 homolog isoform X2 [Papilio polytes]XP_013139270.1 PREDICTED: zinc finger protein 62 homolog isoform X2 [Papilio polytes]XP_013139271.1 PREDICTED: zinc finger protein 62 homolog isoform X2 [Papilio polytes]